MALLRLLLCTLLIGVFTAPSSAIAQETPVPADRSATGGAQTLEDIMARQRGEKVDDSFRRDNTGDADTAAGMASQLGTLGGQSDSEVWRALRYGYDGVEVSAGGDVARVLMQDGGMWWLEFREGPLSKYGAWLMAGTLAALALFYLLRGKIRIDGPKTGRTILRFTSWERFGHWLFAGSFLVLGVTGLVSLFGRTVLIPLFGHETFSLLAIGSKWIHNNVAWAFMLGLIIIIVNWTFHNIPNRHDLVWLSKAGGIDRMRNIGRLPMPSAIMRCKTREVWA